MRTLKTIVCLVLFILTGELSAQDTLFYDENFDKVSTRAACEYFKLIQKDKTDSNKAVVSTYFKSGQIQKEEHYSHYKKSILNGPVRTWYAGGQKKLIAYYLDSQFDGKLETYWESGQLKRDDVYEKGKYVRGQNYDENGKPVDHYDYEVQAQFPGGMREMMKFISNNIQYPKQAREDGISGKVFIRMIIDKDGNVTKISVLKGVTEEIDAEAIRVLNLMPQWEPAMLDGEKVKCFFNIPISFKIS